MHALSIFGLKFHVDRLGTRLLVLPWYASTVTYLPTTAAVPLCRRSTWRSMEKRCSRAAVSSLPDCRGPGILSWLRVIWFHGFCQKCVTASVIYLCVSARASSSLRLGSLLSFNLRWILDLICAPPPPSLCHRRARALLRIRRRRHHRRRRRHNRSVVAVATAAEPEPSFAAIVAASAEPEPSTSIAVVAAGAAAETEPSAAAAAPPSPQPPPQPPSPCRRRRRRAVATIAAVAACGRRRRRRRPAAGAGGGLGKAQRCEDSSIYSPRPPPSLSLG